MRLLIFYTLVFTLWASTLSAPADNTTQHKTIVFPKKTKGNPAEKMVALKNARYSGGVKSIESTSGNSTGSPSFTYVPSTTLEEYTTHSSSVATEQVENSTLMYSNIESSDSEMDESSVAQDDSPADARSESPLSMPVPADANDGLIEYNLGNPLALRLHLPWWPLKDMLKSIQDAISLMNLTMTRATLDTEDTKTKTVRFDDRNYTLKVKVLRPSENNRLLVRLISLTPVIQEGKITMEKGMKDDEEKANEFLDDSTKESLFPIKQKQNEEGGKENENDEDDKLKDDKSKAKDSKKEKQAEKKKEEESDTEEDSD